MTDSGGAAFSLMYLPLNNLTLPAPVAAVIQLTPQLLSNLGLSTPWSAPMSMSTGSGSAAETLVLCAVYEVGETPAL